MDIAEARAALREAGVTNPAVIARQLLAVAAGQSRATEIRPVLTTSEREALGVAVQRFLAGEPLQHITGVAYFRYETLRVGPGVFVPRPETETMVGWVLDCLAGMSEEPLRVVELCGGSGAISLALAHEHPGLEQWVVELSDDAWPYLVDNLAGTGVTCVFGDMADELCHLNATVDVVVANPPYIPWEAWESLPSTVRDYDPHLALFSGADGLAAPHIVADVAWRLLRPGGVVACEHAEVQHEPVQQLFVDHGFAHVRDHQDLTDRWRFVTAVRP